MPVMRIKLHVCAAASHATATHAAAATASGAQFRAAAAARSCKFRENSSEIGEQ